ERVAERAVHRRARGLRVREQERQGDEAELRHAVGQVARGLVTEREQAVLDQPQDIVGAIPQIHDVPDILDRDAVAELCRQPVADTLERAAEAGAGGAVASHSDLDRPGHGCSSSARRVMSSAGGGRSAAPRPPPPRRPPPRASRMPPTPVAAASSPASAGNRICPTRLPVMRSVSAVPQTSGGARYMTPESVSVEAMPMAKPSPTSTRYMTGSESGKARMRKPAALPSMLTSVSGMRPKAKISRA